MLVIRTDRSEKRRSAQFSCHSSCAALSATLLYACPDGGAVDVHVDTTPGIYVDAHFAAAGRLRAVHFDLSATRTRVDVDAALRRAWRTVRANPGRSGAAAREAQQDAAAGHESP